MNNTALFIIGFIITLLVVFAIGGLAYAAVLDQRYHDEITGSNKDNE